MSLHCSLFIVSSVFLTRSTISYLTLSSFCKRVSSRGVGMEVGDAESKYHGTLTVRGRKLAMSSPMYFREGDYQPRPQGLLHFSKWCAGETLGELTLSLIGQVLREC